MTTAEILQKQKDFFATGETRKESWRREILEAIRLGISKYERAFQEALQADLGKSGTESFMTEIGMVTSELKYMERHLHRWMRKRRVLTPLHEFASSSYMLPEPYGCTLVMSPWNYPFLLSLDPVIAAVAAGNTVILKPSAYSSATSEVLKQMFEEWVPPEAVSVVTGGRQVNADLLEYHFDYIFFTGGKDVGRLVMEKASRHLTPVTLELGGKSPCIVDATANIKLAAKRIVFGKFLNCGQTCVAPDYILCDPSVREKLIKELQHQIKKQFGANPLTNKNYGKIINEKHFQRILGLIDPEKTVHGGKSDAASLKIEPTIMDRVTYADAVMQEEIFGPVLPILTYTSLDNAMAKINSMPHPLALYIFSSDKEAIQKVTSGCGFGGGCVNDVIIHLATSEMGFGGFGESGMGSYHGKDGFDTFSHYKSIVDKKTWLDLPMRYQPYRKIYDKMIRMFLK